MWSRVIVDPFVPMLVPYHQDEVNSLVSIDDEVMSNYLEVVDL